MEGDELHYPPGAEPTPEPTPTPAPTPEPTPTPPEPPAPTPPAKPEDKKPEDETPAADPPVLPKKPRSVYDDLKETRQEKNAFKTAAIAALEAAGVKLTGKETAEELTALASKTPEVPPTPPAPVTPPKKEDTPADELEAFAKDNEIDPASLKRLTEIITKRIPATQLSDEEKQGLADLKTWRADQARAAEDAEVLATSSIVKTQLEISDDAELAIVMKEIVRLSHTKEFHDKEVEYILWKKKEALSKLVSPKKPSFEGGGSGGEAPPETQVDFSRTSGITPEMAQRGQSTSSSALDIRRTS
ncbi:MAG: hypothetical protein ACK4UO_13015 [Pseudolabrys sp.]